INGTFRDVQGRNVYGTIGHGDKYIVVSTPISGWFTCGGERGSGIAIWLALARWAADQQLGYTFVFTGNSGHEHAFRGAHEFLERNAPPVEKTKLWIHFGAGAATLEWKNTANGLVKQTNVDPNRRFYFSSDVKEAFEKSFKDIEAQKILANKNPGGELVYVAQKGYTRFAGVSYAHPFFHVKTDDENTTSAEILEVTAKAFRDLILEETK
ncbi:MAG TPA: M28 family peptidase, partial [Paludibacter sp.]